MDTKLKEDLELIINQGYIDESLRKMKVLTKRQVHKAKMRSSRAARSGIVKMAGKIGGPEAAKTARARLFYGYKRKGDDWEPIKKSRAYRTTQARYGDE